MIWSDTPPSESGEYKVKSRRDGWEGAFRFNADEALEDQWWNPALDDWMSSEKMAVIYKFGPRIPSAEKLVELQRKADELDRIHAVWGLKNS